MRNREQVIRDFVQSWLDKAEHDLHAAEILLTSSAELGEVVGFHCQQAAEKFMKAYLVRYQIEFSKTHDLVLLRRLISRSDERLAGRLAFADWLAPFGVEFRYPGDMPRLSQEIIERACADAKQVRFLVVEALQEYLKGEKP